LLLEAAPDAGNPNRTVGEPEQTPQISRLEPPNPSMTNASLTVAVPPIASGTVVETKTAAPPPVRPAQDAVLPKYYTVGAWPPDCFWKIAELVHGDPYRWSVLYEANRSKLGDPENPDLLEAGTVLEIHSVNGEIREGYF
jgi:hypothetical protein